MQQEEIIMSTRESTLSLGCWTKMLFTLGLYLIVWLAKRLVVTNRRVFYTTGIFGKSERSIPLNRVTDITVNRGLLGSLLGYGTIRIESAGGGGTEIVAPGVGNPKGIQDAILSRLQ